MANKKIAILTGGGDAPGLNAVIYAIVRACRPKYDLIGYRFGYRGLYNNDFVPLTRDTTRGILHRGGTMLFSSNKDNLFDYTIEENGVKVKKDVSDVAIANMEKEGVGTLVVLGGDGTLTSARDFARKGFNVIGVPKTIDNDLASTEATFGFDTAVNIVTENLGRLHTTAESHHRIMIAEVMGRSSGWIALYSGIAGSADVILIPEIPYTLEKVVEKIKSRQSTGKNFTVIVVTEGAAEKGGQAVVGRIVEDSPDAIRFGGIAAKLANDIEKHVDNEVRHCTFGHIQRGGETSPADRLLSARYGVKAADMIEKGQFGNMVCLRNGKMDFESLEVVLGSSATGSTAMGLSKRVSLDHELVQVARSLGISLGD
ncbi:MAG: ATP-dependent 6-phosphofructokinase [Firmicutes bacterium]|nr:ATP-dependent 6-phosphofructokinase [Bacillota bacterium]